MERRSRALQFSEDLKLTPITNNQSSQDQWHGLKQHLLVHGFDQPPELQSQGKDKGDLQPQASLWDPKPGGHVKTDNLAPLK